MNIKKIVMVGAAVAMAGAAVAAGTVSGVKARQRYPWNGLVDIDCTVTGTAGTTYSLMVNARDKVGGTNLTVKTVSVEGESASGNPVSVTSGVYRLVWNADTDLPNGFRGEKVSISVTVTDSAKKFMIVDLETGAITYQAAAPEGGWDVDEYKGTKMAFVRIEPGTFTQYSVEGMPGREVTITKPYYMGILPVTHKQLRTLVGASSVYEYGKDDHGYTRYISYSFADSVEYYAAAGSQNVSTADRFSDRWCQNAMLPYRGIQCGDLHWRVSGTIHTLIPKLWPTVGRAVAAESPLGVLRSRTGLQKFDLPTEAQTMKARESLMWSGSTLCLDCWCPWLGTSATIDPLGKVQDDMFLEVYISPSGLTEISAEFYSSCIGEMTRNSTQDTNPYVRFCLYEAD